MVLIIVILDVSFLIKNNQFLIGNMELIIFFIVGLMVGSFLNVVIYRLNLAESIFWGRSHCPHCKAKINWYDNIPLLSFILLQGKCRYCGEKISWQYPIVEFSTGLSFILLAEIFLQNHSWLNWLEVIFYLVLVSLLIVILVYDLKFLKIPLLIIWLAVAWTSAYYLLVDSFNFPVLINFWDSRFLSGLIGGAIASSFFLFLVIISREKWMGMGDVYLGFLIGLVIGWPNILLVLMLSFLLGSVVGLTLVISKRKKMSSQLPFGPFLIISLFLIIFLLKFFPAIDSYLRFYY